MKCPACENELSEYKISGIRVNVCSGFCGGLWFNLTQVRKIERLKQGAGSALLNFEIADGVKTYREAEHPCPHCKTTLLYRRFFSRNFDTEINQCSKCSGFWIDTGGLVDIMKKSENKIKKTLSNIEKKTEKKSKSKKKSDDEIEDADFEVVD